MLMEVLRRGLNETLLMGLFALVMKVVTLVISKMVPVEIHGAMLCLTS